MAVAPYVMLYLIPAAIALGLAFYGWQRRHYRAAEQFSLLMLALAGWSACHALSVADMTLEGTLFWSKVQYAGVVLVPPLWLLFALAYADQWWRATLRLRALLFVVAMLTYTIVLTNDIHQLWWTKVAIDTSRPFVSLMVERGWPFWFHTAYSYTCIGIGLAFFFRTMILAPPIYQRQSLLMTIGALVPIAGNLAHLLGLNIRAVDDPTPFLFLGSGLVSFYALQRYQLLNLAPIAAREVFASMPDGVVALDRRGLVAAFNGPAPALLGVSLNHGIGRPFRDLIGASPLAADLRALLEAPAGLASRRVTYIGPDDGLRGVEIRLRPLLADHNKPAGALLVLRDTTERVRMEQALDQRFAELVLLNQIARAANAAVQTDDLIRVVTRETVQSLAWNRVAIGMLEQDGVTLRLVIDHPADNRPTLEGRYVSASDFAPLLEALRTRRTAVLDGTDPCLAETLTGRVMRRLRLQSVIAAPLSSQSALLGVLFVGSTDAQPVTPEHVRLAEMVAELVTDAVVRARLYEEAQQASKLKSTFLATVSHEVRTPLTSIIGYADMLQRGVYGPLPDSMQDPLTFIRHGSHTLLRLITDILDYSRMEAGRFSIDLYSFDVAAAVRNVVGALRPQAEERGLELRLELSPGLPLVYANNTRVEQVLTNLIANAIKFTDRGSITVRTASLGDRVRVSVQDTGIGIAVEDQGVIFGEFRQIENAHTRRHGGTGLGLAISRRLMELMGGSLTLESAPGVGSTFACELRVATVAALEKAVSH